MKKVLKLIVLVAVISALTLVAFAASSPSTEVIPDESGAAELVAIIAEQIPAGYDIEVAPPTESAANEDAAKAADEDPIILDSFDINVTDAEGNEAHSGPVVTITLNVGAQYAGWTLKLYETTDGVTRLYGTFIVDAEGVITIPISSFSTFTPVLVKPEEVVAPGPVTPQTMQTLLPIALGILAVAAVAVAVVAKKHSFN